MSGLLLGIGGLAVSVAGSAFSFARAGKQRKEARSATNQAQAAMAKAKKRTEMNKYGKLAINKDIYKDQRDSVTAASAQVTQAAAEGDQRGVGATAGKITATAQQMQQQITQVQNAEAQKLEMVKAAEDARLADEAMRIDMGEGNQLFASANALNEMSAESTAQGVKGLTAAAQQGIKLGMSGVGGGAASREFKRLGKAADLQGTNDLDNARLALLASQQEGGIGYDRFSGMERGQEFQDFMDDLEQGRGTTDFSSDWFQKQATKFYTPDDFNFLREQYRQKGIRR